MGRLRFDGVNDNVTLASGITGNVGTQTYSYRVKGILNALPTVAGTPGAFGFIGTTATGQGNGICVYSTGAVGVISGNTPRYGTNAGFLSVGVPFDFTISHINTGAWTITDNITTTVVASGTFTASTSWSGSLNNIGRLNSSTVHYLNADIEFIEVTGHVNAQRWDADLSGGTGNVFPTVSGSNQGTLVNFPTDNNQWVGFGGGGTAQDITLVNAQQLVEAVQATVSTSQAIAAVNAEQLTQATLVAVSVSQAIAAVNAETAVQAVTANISAGQAISAINAQQLVEALQVTIIQGGAAPAQDVTALPAQQLVESVQVSITANQNVATIDAQQLIQAEQALVSMLQSITSLNAQQAVQALQVTVTQGGLPPVQDVTALPAQQLTEAVSVAIGFNQTVISTAAQQATEAVVVNCTISQGVVSIDAETDQQAEPAVVSMVQQITVAIAQQLTQAVRAGEVTAPPIIAAKVKVTLIPSRFTINIVN